MNWVNSHSDMDNIINIIAVVLVVGGGGAAAQSKNKAHCSSW